MGFKKRTALGSLNRAQETTLMQAEYKGNLVKTVEGAKFTTFSFFSTPSGSHRKLRVPSPTVERSGCTVTFDAGFVEDFSAGWSIETTYGSFRQRAMDMLTISEASDEAANTCMEAAIIFLVSGLESMIRFALGTGKERTPCQSLKAYDRALKKKFGRAYVPLAGETGRAVDRLLKVRHAIIHNNGKATAQVVRTVNNNIARNAKLSFCAKDVEKLITNATDQFAAKVAKCRGSSWPEAEGPSFEARPA